MLSRILAYRARLGPHDLAVVRAGQGVSFSGLERDAETLALQIAHRLPNDGRPVAVAVTDGALHWALLTALDRLGACAVSVRDPAEAARFNAALAIGDVATPAGSDGAPEVIVADLSRPPGATPASLPPAPAPGSDAPLRVFAAGTRAFTLSSAQTQARLSQFGPGFAPGAHRLLNASARIDVLRFHQTLAHWLQGGCLVQPALGEDWTDTLMRDRVDLVLADPAALVAALARDAADLPRVDGLTVVADGALDAGAARALRRRLAGRVIALRHHPQVGLVAMADCGGEGERDGEMLRAPWFCETQVVDGRGRELAPGRPGTVRHRAAGQAEGYLDDAEAAARHFRRGWFHPGGTGRGPQLGGHVLDLDPVAGGEA